MGGVLVHLSVPRLDLAAALVQGVITAALSRLGHGEPAATAIADAGELALGGLDRLCAKAAHGHDSGDVAARGRA